MEYSILLFLVIGVQLDTCVISPASNLALIIQRLTGYKIAIGVNLTNLC